MEDGPGGRLSALDPHRVDARHFLIAGAGIGGLAAALALARTGARITLLEQAPVLEEAGAGLQLSPNASGILSELGVLPRLEGLAMAPERLRVRSATSGRDLMFMPLGQTARARWGAPTLVVHRADLQRALLEAVAEQDMITLRTGVEITAFTRETDGVHVHATGDTGTICGDVLIGADGAHSRIRRSLGLGSEPVWSGRTAWRALVPASEAPAFARADETSLWLGARTHLVHYPLRQGALINIVAITDDGWRGADPARFWTERGDERVVTQRFADWHMEARGLLECVRDWRRWPLFDCDPLKRWSAGPVALLGDAAHPMLPFFAQGAAQAIEDAGALGQAFMPCATGVPSITRALADYERKRVARAARVQTASRRQAMIYHLSGPAALVRDIGMRALPPQAVMARFDWLYRYPA